MIISALIPELSSAPTNELNVFSAEADAKLAFAIAVLALLVTAVDKTPLVPSIFPSEPKLNTASSLSTEVADAKDAFAIAVLALEVTAVDKTPEVPSTSPLLSKENTASNLSRSLATAPAAEVDIVVILVDKASATPVIFAPVNTNCDSNSVIFVAPEDISPAFVDILDKAVALEEITTGSLSSPAITQFVPSNIYSLFPSLVSYQIEFNGIPDVVGSASCLNTLFPKLDVSAVNAVAVLPLSVTTVLICPVIVARL